MLTYRLFKSMPSVQT